MSALSNSRDSSVGLTHPAGHSGIKSQQTMKHGSSMVDVTCLLLTLIATETVSISGIGEFSLAASTDLVFGPTQQVQQAYAIPSVTKMFGYGFFHAL